MIIFGIISLLVPLLIIAIHALTSDDVKPSIIGVCTLIMSVAILSLTQGVLKERLELEKEIAIECLKGNNPYKMEIRYELQDSIYAPVDTIYIKIK